MTLRRAKLAAFSLQLVCGSPETAGADRCPAELGPACAAELGPAAATRAAAEEAALQCAEKPWSRGGSEADVRGKLVRVLEQCAEDTTVMRPLLDDDKRALHSVLVGAAEANRIVWLLPSSHHEICLVDNFVAQMVGHLDDVPPLVVAALDGDMALECNALSANHAFLHCVNISGSFVGLGASTPSESAGSSPKLNTCFFSALTWAKPLLLREAIDAVPSGVLIVDADVVILRDVSVWIREQLNREDSVSQPTLWVGLNPDWKEASKNANTGILFATAAERLVLDRWLAQRANWRARFRGIARRREESVGLYGDVEGLMDLLDVDGTFRLRQIPRGVVEMCSPDSVPPGEHGGVGLLGRGPGVQSARVVAGGSGEPSNWVNRDTLRSSSMN